MIFDSISNIRLYEGIEPNLYRALRHLAERDLGGLTAGRYELESDSLYFLIQEYDSKPVEQGKIEAHVRYLDIQYVIEGAERIGFAKTGYLKPLGDYNPAKDMAYFEGVCDWVTVRSGEFVILHPDDAHMPGIAIAEPARVKKAVFKVKL